MANFNQVILMGNLTRDPQVRFTAQQQQVCDFGIAVNRKYRLQSGEEREEVMFVDCSAWGKTAENINRFFTKGKPIFIIGRLKLDTWEDKQGGGKRSKHSVVVETFQFIGGRDGGGGGGGNYSSAPEEGDQTQQRVQQRAPQQPTKPAPQQPFSDEPQFKEDDIPF
jgi:single-strand DNA-binding protein